MLHSLVIPSIASAFFAFCLLYLLLRLRRFPSLLFSLTSTHTGASRKLAVVFYHLDHTLFLTSSESNVLQVELVLLYPSLCGLARGSRSLGWYR